MGGRDARMSRPAYRGVLVQLNPRWRVAGGSDKPEFVLQVRTHDSGEERWRGRAWAASRERLLGEIEDLGIRLDAAAEASLAALPAWAPEPHREGAR